MASDPEAGGGTIAVSVCYADTAAIWSREVRLRQGATLGEAIEASGFRAAFPGIDPAQSGTGIYGRRRGLEYVLRDRDRVEIYRPLVFDPKESRRRRAEHRQAAAARTR